MTVLGNIRLRAIVPCETCGGEGYIAVDGDGPFIEEKRCPNCEGQGELERWLSLETIVAAIRKELTQNPDLAARTLAYLSGQTLEEANRGQESAAMTGPRASFQGPTPAPRGTARAPSKGERSNGTPYR